MKVAICFFGITRSLKYTVSSIESNILNILKKNKIDYDIFMHTYNLETTYRNIRTGETYSNMDNSEYKLLNPKFIIIESQDDIKTKINFKKYRTHRDPWNTEYNSVDNHLLALWSKNKLVKMVKNSNTVYDYILYVRPDCKYINPLNINWFKRVKDNIILTPSFHLFGKYNLNDRFAICNNKNYMFYGNIFESALEYSKKMPLHSETILGHHCNLNGIKIEKIKFIFQRVRMKGNINKGDLSLIKLV